jgi:anthranilate phosphoribosyltransferase
MNLTDAIRKVTAGASLSEEEARLAMEEIFEGRATPAQIGGFLVGMRMKGETAAEIAGCARSMRAHAIPVRPPAGIVADTCGTGGDGKDTANVSTAAAFVLAASGVVVAKHGNRAVSSRSGSADVLEALGVAIDLDAAGVEACLREAGIGFLFAPRFHVAMRHAAPARKELGVRTLFNVLGPLTNPAAVTCQLVGVYGASLTGLLADVLVLLGVTDALVVHGEDGLDEMSLSGPTRIAEVRDGSVEHYAIWPEDVGLERADLEALAGSTPAGNAEILRGVLSGRPGPHRDATVLNAAGALYAAGKAENLKEGVELAVRLVDSGAALDRLERLITSSAKGRRA